MVFKPRGCEFEPHPTHLVSFLIWINTIESQTKQNCCPCQHTLYLSIILQKRSDEILVKSISSTTSIYNCILERNVKRRHYIRATRKSMVNSLFNNCCEWSLYKSCLSYIPDLKCVMNEICYCFGGKFDMGNFGKENVEKDVRPKITIISIENDNAESLTPLL